jgi:CheY-like chemotaxis protein
MQAVLQLTGVRVAQVSSGAEGLARWAAEPPNAVLSDIAMPEMDGYEFIRAPRRSMQGSIDKWRSRRTLRDWRR